MRRVAQAAIATVIATTAFAGLGVIDELRAAGNQTVFVPIVPCRLADTRPPGVGGRTHPLDAGETAVFTVWGDQGNCAVPTTAVGIATNVTAVNPTAGSFLALFPADAQLPVVSNLNFVAGSPPTPNQVTVGLSDDGRVGVHNHAGTVDVIIDVVGYYEHGSGTAGPPGAPGPRGFSAWDAIPSGVTVIGEVNWDLTTPGGSVPSDRITVNLPGVAPVALTDATVNFAPGSAVSDADATCTGSFDAPSAPPGKVCLYGGTVESVETISGLAGRLATRAFHVRYHPVLTAAGSDMILWFTWAYTAP